MKDESGQDGRDPEPAGPGGRTPAPPEGPVPAWPRLSPFSTGIRGRCPRCGRGHLFEGFLTLAPRCEVCGLDYAFADPADGPAFFVICFTCVPAVLFAVWLEVAYEVPYWVHLVTSLPVLLLTCIPPLRPLKGWLIASQYVYKAEEGRLAAVETSASHDRPPDR